MITFLDRDHLLIRFLVLFIKVYSTELMSILLICDSFSTIWKVFNQGIHEQFITAQMMMISIQQFT